MKYIVYFEPNKELKNEVSRLRKLVNESPFSHPSLDTHCTIAIWKTNPEYEQRMIEELENVWCQPIRTTVKGIEMFDGGALVAKLDKTAVVEQLHYAVLDALMVAPKDPVADDPSLSDIAHSQRRLYGSEYFGHYYQPHVTIARVNPSTINLTDLTIQTQDVWAHEFVLARKEDEWKRIALFSMSGALEHY